MTQPIIAVPAGNARKTATNHALLALGQVPFARGCVLVKMAKDIRISPSLAAQKPPM